MTTGRKQEAVQDNKKKITANMLYNLLERALNIEDYEYRLQALKGRIGYFYNQDDNGFMRLSDKTEEQLRKEGQSEI